MAAPAAPATQDDRDDPGDRYEADDPAAGGADRAVYAAAQELKGGIERGDRAALVDLVSGIAEEQKPTERHHEGRDPGIGDERALKEPDQPTCREHCEAGHPPRAGTVDR